MGTKVKKHGIRASHTADVFLDDCRVPGSCLLGGKEKLDERLARAREGARSKEQAAMRTFEVSRPTVGAQALGIARAAYEYALDYAKQRVQFGRPIIENQAIAFTLADMRMEIDAARLLVWRAAWMGRSDQPFTAAEGSMSKLKAGEVAVWVTERAIQILGGNGYTREYPVERMAPRRQDLHDLRGHVRDPAACDRAGDLGVADPVIARSPAARPPGELPQVGHRIGARPDPRDHRQLADVGGRDPAAGAAPHGDRTRPARPRRIREAARRLLARRVRERRARPADRPRGRQGDDRRPLTRRRGGDAVRLPVPGAGGAAGARVERRAR